MNSCPDRRKVSLIRHDLEVVQQMEKIVQSFNYRPSLIPMAFQRKVHNHLVILYYEPEDQPQQVGEGSFY